MFGAGQEEDFDRLPISHESTAKFFAAGQRSRRFESAKKREANFVIGTSPFD